jgi:hypothetical protein
VKKPLQRAFCCPCGRTDILALGLCGTCYTLRRQDQEYFGGLREEVLRRDGYRCRVCDSLKPGVHHRVPGVSRLHLMIALCAGCHAKVHRTRSMFPTVDTSPLLLILWREQHPGGHEQTALDFNFTTPVARERRLFEHEKELAKAD